MLSDADDQRYFDMVQEGIELAAKLERESREHFGLNPPELADRSDMVRVGKLVAHLRAASQISGQGRTKQRAARRRAR